MKTLAQVIDRDVVAEVGKKVFKGVAVVTAIFGGVAGLALLMLMHLPTC